VEAGVSAPSAAALVFDSTAVLERVEATGDLFAPLLSEKQDLPKG
jgi:hypothetical protein